jgi:hypothetical protein
LIILNPLIYINKFVRRRSCSVTALFHGGNQMNGPTMTNLAALKPSTIREEDVEEGEDDPEFMAEIGQFPISQGQLNLKLFITYRTIKEIKMLHKTIKGLVNRRQELPG